MAGNTEWLTIHPERPEPELIDRAAALIQSSGLVIFPTKGLYGLAADARSQTAVNRIFQAKQRPLDKPLLLLINNRSDLSALTPDIPEPAIRIMDRFWPGDVTIVVNAAPHLSGKLTAGTGKIGIRMPQHPVAKALVSAVGFPVTGTSANISGMPGCSHPDQLDPYLIHNTDLLLDAGKLHGGLGSTVVDTTTTPVRILRQGRISEADILSAIA